VKKILVVDNHPAILQFMSSLLEKEGHQVLSAENGLSALDILKTYEPDIIFVDLVMPNISGKKLCRIIRDTPHLKDVYIVILSAIAAEDAANISEYGANACIAKGLSKELAKNVLEVVARSDQETSAPGSREIVGLETVHAREVTKELLSIQRHFEVILGSVSEGILEITVDGRILYVNSTALSMFRISEEELLGSNIIALFHQADHEKIRGLIADVAGSSKVISEDSFVRLNGKEFLLRVSPLGDPEHKAIIILNDVSERKQIEAQLQQAQKMEAVGTLAGGIAHDFNNLLMGIQGNTSLMLMDIEPTHPHFNRLKGIEKHVKSGSKLTGQLLGYARKGRYEVRPVDLSQIVAETSETFGRTKKEITIYKDLEEGLHPVEVDQGQIEQVLLNLYVNAADAMPGGGELFLKTMNASHKEMGAKLYSPKPGDYVLLDVKDTGIGMDKKTQERIFEPFFTTKEMGRGTGLGLASVYGIIKGHGGYVDVESREGHGTTFKVYLPASKEALRDQWEVGEKKEMREREEMILLVDDEEIICRVGQEMLEAMGYQVLIAKEADEALKLYQEKQDGIDLVLLDMVMPGMGGGEAYDRLKEVDPGVKVLLSSGYSIDGEASEIMNRGCNGFIQKPFSMKELSQSIEDILDTK
jgi:PAS domain S-box-containing protein